MTNPADHIEIHPVAVFLENQSDPAAGRFAFAYTIQITNNGPEPVQLLSRHWYITDAGNEVEEVEGPGVVGLQPVIDPGETFQYSSGAIIETETGTMHGSYRMVTDAGESFDAPIPMFLLAPPRTIH